ncbi:MAG: protocatechuate 3,4-dioxygenase subunit beta [Acidobacteriaceae bacterium]|jgi:protocatechuate 3,4-dioxygenase beta subunit
MRSDAYVATPPAGTQPDFHYPPYVSSVARSPRQPLVPLLRTVSERTGPIFGQGIVSPSDSDLTAQHDGDPLGERIVVHGRVLDQNRQPVRSALVEVWQANAAGRYRHKVDQHHAPLDPNFSGCGRVLTDNNGYYCFRTIKPGAYPWQNHHNAWRPAHIHFSLFGSGILSRLVTQMYFPGDPLQSHDPILNSIPDECGRQRLIARLDMDRTEPGLALAFSWDIVLRGPEETPFEAGRR